MSNGHTPEKKFLTARRTVLTEDLDSNFSAARHRAASRLR